MTKPVPVRLARWSALVAALALLATSLTVTTAAGAGATVSIDPLPSAAVAPASRPADPVAHDPTMVKEGGWYYVAITGDAGRSNTFLPMKRSRDLVHWQEIGPVFRALPSWVAPALGVDAAAAPKDLWAPDLSYAHGEWRLYYAGSIFGGNTSVIGLATTKTLDPHSKAFGWHDRGQVLRSTDYRQPGGDSYNAIDPNIAVDAAGATWLSFGSFFSGIWLHRIDARTGKIPSGDVAVNIAQRAAPDAEENSSIVYHRGFYYLFLSFDYCCRGVESDYRTVVGRSRTITGPFVDAAGVPLLNDKGGTELMRGYNEFVGAGGADVLLGSHGAPDLVVNHYYDATDAATPKLNVRRLVWTTKKWPRVSFPLNPSRSVGHGDAYVKIVPRGATTVVEDVGCGYEGAKIALGADLGSRCQQWQLSDRGEGTRIANRFSNDVAEDAGCHNTDGAEIAQWGWLGFQGDNVCQRWSFAPASDGFSTISTVQAGGLSWTAEGAVTAPGTGIAIDAPTAALDQQFRFDPVGTVLLASSTSATKTLGVVGCRSRRHAGSSSTAFQHRAARSCQEWRVRPVKGADAAVFHVVDATSGRQLAASTHGLRVVEPRGADVVERTWTLTPSDSGTWTLSSGSTRVVVKLLLP